MRSINLIEIHKIFLSKTMSLKCTEAQNATKIKEQFDPLCNHLKKVKNYYEPPEQENSFVVISALVLLSVIWWV